MSIDYERIVVDVYVHNLVVALPVTIIAIKLFVRIVTREPRKDIFRSMLVLPLDFVYVAYGLLLAGIAGRIPTFATHYANSKEATLSGVVLCVGLFLVACFITMLDRLVRLLWQKFYASWTVMRMIKESKQGHPSQLSLPGQQLGDAEAGFSVLWMFIYWSLMIPIIVIEMIFSLGCLGGILKRLQ